MKTILGQPYKIPPPEISDASEKNKKLTFEDVKRTRTRFASLYKKREPWVKRWKAIRDYQLPYLGEFEDTADIIDPARRRDTKIYGGVCWEACQTFGAGVMSGLTPPSRQWFRIAFSRPELASDLGDVLDDRLEILTSVLSKSNFYNTVHNVYLELPFGQSLMGIMPDANTGVHFVHFPVGTYALDCSANGTVNTFARKFEMTAMQLAEQFGTEGLPDNIIDDLNRDGCSASYKVCWLIEPNPYAQPNQIGAKYMKYRSVYWLEAYNEKEEFLHVGGFNEFPIFAARYMVNQLQPYGKGPGWFAEGDSKAYIVMKKNYLKLTQILVEPPMQGTPEHTYKPISFTPGAMNTTAGGGQPLQPLYKPDSGALIIAEEIRYIESAIKRQYSADLFLLINETQEKNMTATEVSRRTQEQLQQLGPVVERLQFEFLSPAIERIYNLLERAEIFPPLDEEAAEILQREDMKIEYISPLAQAQKLNGLVNIEQAIAFVGQMLQIWPEVREKIEPFATVDKYLDWLGAPNKMRRSTDEVQQIIAEQQKQAQQKEALDQMSVAAQAAAPAAQAAKNLTDAAMDGNPVLQQLMGG